MKNIKQRLLRCAICLLPFAVLFVLTKLFFNDVFVLNWMMRNWYLFLWAIAAAAAFFSTKWGYVISFSFPMCVAVGQIVGDIVKARNIALITPDMDAEQEYLLSHHPGLEICLFTFLGIIVIYAIASAIYRGVKKRKASRAEGAKS